MGSSGLYWVLLGCTGLYWVLLGCTGLYWALMGSSGFFGAEKVSLRGSQDRETGDGRREGQGHQDAVWQGCDMLTSDLFTSDPCLSCGISDG